MYYFSCAEQECIWWWDTWWVQLCTSYTSSRTRRSMVD